MPDPTPLTLRGRVIGQRTAQGACLDKAVFASLSISDRLRAYLLFAAPRPVKASTLEQVCTLPRGSAKSYLTRLLQGDEVRQVAYGWYAWNQEWVPRATTRTYALLTLVRHAPGQSTLALTRQRGITRQAVQQNLARLQARGLVRREMRGGSGYWYPVTPEDGQPHA